jgi:hypothetical protein
MKKIFAIALITVSLGWALLVAGDRHRVVPGERRPQ